MMMAANSNSASVFSLQPPVSISTTTGKKQRNRSRIQFIRSIRLASMSTFTSVESVIFNAPSKFLSG